MLITTIGLNTPESTCLSSGKLIVLQFIKNEMPFFQLQKTYEETFSEKYSM
jgi:hypothetical protein